MPGRSSGSIPGSSTTSAALPVLAVNADFLPRGSAKRSGMRRPSSSRTRVAIFARHNSPQNSTTAASTAAIHHQQVATKPTTSKTTIKAFTFVLLCTATQTISGVSVNIRTRSDIRLYLRRPVTGEHPRKPIL